MRAHILATLASVAATSLALGACAPATETPVDAPAAEPAAAEPAAAEDHSGHGEMTADMASADAADDAATAETPAGFTFHTYPNKVESVHLPTAAGEAWTASASDATLVSVGDAADLVMPDGSTHHVVKVTPLASGNATVTFERKSTADAASAATDTRVINFMVH